MFPYVEQYEHGQRKAAAQQHGRGHPAPVLTARNDEQKRHHSQHEENGTRIIKGLGGFAIPVFRQDEPAGDKAEHPDRDVDPENRSPAQMLDENPSDSRAGKGTERDHGARDAHGSSPPLAGEHLGDDRLAVGHEARGSQRLQDP